MSNSKGSISWYVAAIVSIVIIVVVGVVTYEVTLPRPTPSTSPTAVPTSTAAPTSSGSSTPSTSPVSTSTPTPTSTSSSGAVTMDVYGGPDTSGSGTYGFGTSANNIISPGPTLTFKMGTTYTVNFHNVGQIPHAWELVSSKAVSQSPLFGAGINIDSYVSPGSSASVTFTPDKTGDYYYVCTVPGHISLGMWGNAKVTS